MVFVVGNFFCCDLYMLEERMDEVFLLVGLVGLVVVEELLVVVVDFFVGYLYVL